MLAAPMGDDEGELFGPLHEEEEFGLFGAEHQRQACLCERFDRFSLAVDSRRCPVHRGLSTSAAPERPSADWDGIDAILASDRAAIDGSEPIHKQEES